MVITLDRDLENALNERAQQQGVSPETLAIGALRAQFLSQTPSPEAGDDWVRRLRRIATDCGVALSDEAVSSEGIYE
jgi:hypothetical protein